MPFKDRVKQLKFMRNYQRKRRVKLKTQDEADKALRQAIKIGRQHLIGRRFYPIELLSDAPPASLTLEGLNLPIIHAQFELGDGASLRQAALRVVEEEDKLLLVGDHKGWKALGIEGLATASNRNVVKSTGDWFTDAAHAVVKLKQHHQLPPYSVVLNSKWRQIFENDLHKPGYHYSPVLCDAKGETNNAIIVKVDKENCNLLIGQDLTVHIDKVCRVWEALTPIIKNPKAICEITNVHF